MKTAKAWYALPKAKQIAMGTVLFNRYTDATFATAVSFVCCVNFILYLDSGFLLNWGIPDYRAIDSGAVWTGKLSYIHRHSPALTVKCAITSRAKLWKVLIPSHIFHPVGIHWLFLILRTWQVEAKVPMDGIIQRVAK